MKYPKINTLFKRDERNIIIPNDFTNETFEYLKDNKWECTEKIDGTNIHIDLSVDSCGYTSFSINGRTDSAIIPPHLLAKLNQKFVKDNISDCFNCNGAPLEVSIFGEGYGMKIQKGGNYISNDVDFILFDININGVWLKRESLEGIANKLNLDIVPIIGYMTIPEAIAYVDKGFKSTISENKEYDAEGLVLKTPCQLNDRMGDRIITKIKTVDFRKLRNLIAIYYLDSI